MTAHHVVPSLIGTTAVIVGVVCGVLGWLVRSPDSSSRHTWRIGAWVCWWLVVISAIVRDPHMAWWRWVLDGIALVWIWTKLGNDWRERERLLKVERLAAKR